MALSASGLPSAATGSVTFTSAGDTLCSASVASGQASCSTTTLPAGPYAVTAAYAGDADYLGSSAAASFSITKVATSLSASASPSSTTYDGGVDSTLFASGLPADATGSVTFSAGGTTLCSASASTGAASCSAGTQDAGSYSVIATYPGDANYAGSTATTSFTVVQATAHFTAAASPAATTYGNAVTLTAAALPADATGAVAFSLTGVGTGLCSSAVESGSASCSTGVLTPGVYAVTATYSGDTDHEGSAALTSFTVGRATTSITASAAPSSTSSGGTVGLSASGLASGATGSVTFTSEGATLCTASVSDGGASCSTGVLPVGSYPVTATYSGNADYAGSTATTTFSITRMVTSFDASASPSSTAYGGTVGLSASDLPSGATGSVTFTAGASTLCTASVSDGGASCSTEVLPAGAYSVTAAYSGDTDYAGSSATAAFSITKAPTSISASASPSSVTYDSGSHPTLLASGLPSDATGSVTFTAGATTLCSASVTSGEASCSAGARDAGAYSVTASFSGDPNYQGSTATTGFTVNQATTSLAASASPSSTTYGTAVALEASELASDATGSVTFTVTGVGTTLCTASVGSGSAPCSTGEVIPGVYAVTATYSGDTDYTGASAVTGFSVGQAATSISASASPSSVGYGGTAGLSASGLPADATGSVTFTSGAATLCTATVSSGGASCETATLPVGTYPVTATYSGDTDYTGSTATASFSVTRASTSISASASPSSTTYGNEVTLTASELPSDAGGSVTFTSAGDTLCSASVASGQASCSTTTLPAGSYAVTAVYSGDTDYLGSSAVASFSITQVATSLSASASPPTAGYGLPVALFSTGLPADATGSVTFTSGTVTLCSATVSAGGASCSTGTLAPGDYPVTATYSGDTDYAGSAATTSFTVVQATTALSASAIPSSSTYGTHVTLSASGLAIDATGTAAFSLTGVGTGLCSSAVESGSASCSTGVLTPGVYAVTATYSGDADYTAATALTSFAVSQAATSITASASPSTSGYGNPVGLSASGLASGATGSVTFTSEGATLCTASVSDGGASCSTGVLPVGSYPVTATYSGNADYAGSTATTTFSITRMVTSFDASASPSSTAYGGTVGLSASDLPSGATGSVTFTAGASTLCTASVSDGGASCSTEVLPAGAYSVTAAYSGDTDYAGSSATAAFSITKAPTSISASASPSSVTYDSGSHPTLLASGLPSDATGSVTFTAGATTLCSASVTSGEASCSAGARDAGAYSVTASFSGDPNYQGSTATTGFTVNQATTSLAASASPSSTTYGTAVALEASELASDATGSVTFTVTGVGTTLCTASVGSGSASCSTGEVIPGVYAVTATYSGDTDYTGASAVTGFSVGQAATSISASASPSSVGYGGTAGLSASGLPADATGSVTFTSGAATLCTATVSSGGASCETATLPVGTYPVTATYSGDTDYTGSTATASFSVTRASTSISASASPSSVRYASGTTPTLSASGLPSDAGGSVNFTLTSDGSTLCTASVVSGGASCSAAATAAGSHAVTATYSGDADYAGSAATTTFSVTQASTSISASADPSTTTYGSGVTVSASGLPDDATGSVTFTSGTVTLCTGTVSSGAASCSTGEIGAGEYPVTADYSGDTDYAASSATTGFTITPGPTSISAGSGGDFAAGGEADLWASGLPFGIAGEEITFTTAGGTVLCTADYAAGRAECFSGPLDAGEYSVTATYSGDQDYLGSVADTGFDVTPDPVLDLIASSSAPDLSAGSQYTIAIDPSVDASGGTAYNDPELTLTLPTGETIDTVPDTSDWSCSLSGRTELHCRSKASGPVGAGTELGDFAVTVDVDPAASGTLSTLLTLSDDPDNAIDGAASPSVDVTPPPGFNLVMSGTPSRVTAGSSYLLSLALSLNDSGGPAYHTPTLTVTLPAGESFAAAPDVSGWDCTLADGDTQLVCTSTAVTPIDAGTDLPTVSAVVYVSDTTIGNLVTTASLSDSADGASPAGGVQAVTVVDAATSSGAPTPGTGAPAAPASTWIAGLLLVALGLLLVTWRRRRRFGGSVSRP